MIHIYAAQIAKLFLRLHSIIYPFILDSTKPALLHVQLYENTASLSLSTSDSGTALPILADT